MLFAEIIVLFNETRDGLNSKLEQWGYTLKSRRFRLSMSKTEYLKCEFGGVEDSYAEVIMGGVAYQGSRSSSISAQSLRRMKILAIVLEWNKKKIEKCFQSAV